MSLSKSVQISKLYPSNIEDLSKNFRTVEIIDNPYGISRANSIESMIQDLVVEVEAGLDIKDSSRKNGPYSSGLDKKIDTVNLATTIITDDLSRQVPEDLRFIQLAGFHNPEVNGQRYSYGLMLHFGEYSTHHNPEFAVLLPYEKDNTIPALILSNNSFDAPEKNLGLIVKALTYARENSNK